MLWGVKLWEGYGQLRNSCGCDWIYIHIYTYNKNKPATLESLSKKATFKNNWKGLEVGQGLRYISCIGSGGPKQHHSIRPLHWMNQGLSGPRNYQKVPSWFDSTCTKTASRATASSSTRQMRKLRLGNGQKIYWTSRSSTLSDYRSLSSAVILICSLLSWVFRALLHRAKHLVFLTTLEAGLVSDLSFGPSWVGYLKSILSKYFEPAFSYLSNE